MSLKKPVTASGGAQLDVGQCVHKDSEADTEQNQRVCVDQQMLRLTCSWLF